MNPSPADRPLRVLLAASEVVGFAKTGGLADVAGSLPRALAKRGVEAAVVMPLYRTVATGRVPLTRTNVTLSVPVGPRTYEGRIWRATLPDSEVPVYLVEQPEFFDRDDPAHGRGLYQYSVPGGKRDYPDNGERFLFFCRAVLEALPALNWWPDVLHANDWQTGLLPVYVRELYGRASARYAHLRTLITIHNIAYQGHFPPLVMALTGLDAHLFNYQQLEFYGLLNFLKAGIVFADAISTVSPRYAQEIQTMVFGYGLEGVLSERKARLTGIVNGVDYRDWDPAHDRHLAATYGPDTVFERKPLCKAALQREYHLPERPEAPLFGLVARLAEQKGIELVVQSAHELLSHDVQIVVLGEGDPRYHHQLQAIRDHYPQKVGVYFGFDEGKAHRVEAGSDAFLMPSQFEPSGLNQLYSLKYGTVPVVRAVGGLYDTITDCTPETLAAGTANGFRFGPYTPPAFQAAVHRALACYRHEPSVWRQVVRTGMGQDWSWDRSAGEYETLYRRMLEH
jgi:starch synthase